MAVTAERKIEVAERSFRLLVEKWGIAPEDIYFDPLVFPCGTGDVQYVGSAKETIDGVRRIKERLPRCKVVLGISNVSFGLPEAGRGISEFCLPPPVGARRPRSRHRQHREVGALSLDPRRAEEGSGRIIDHVGDDPVAVFAALFRNRAPKEKASDSVQRTADERISLCVVEGSREGLIDALEEKRKEASPLEIINGPLMAGMDEVGRLFGRNELIVAEVLQSAEVMKAAVDHLEPFMSRADAMTRGKILLATVKGDVHDIGKNLVEIIFANNGFEVVDLGIKVQPEVLLEAIREHRPTWLACRGCW